MLAPEDHAAGSGGRQKVDQLLPRWTDRKIPIRVTVRAKVSPRIGRAIQNVLALAQDPHLLAALLRQAVIETVLLKYRERFLARLPEAVATERESGGPKFRNSAAVRIKRAKLRARLRAAYEQGHAREIQRAQAAYSKELRLFRRKERSLPSGRFRSLAFRVLSMAADAASVQTIRADKSGIKLGIGSKSALDAIETPSATPDLTGRGTTSPRKTLWRHLEFGTGLYRSKALKLGKSRFRTAGGGWFFGAAPHLGLRLRGSRGVHAMWDSQGKTYEQDAVDLRLRFRELLRRAIFG